MGYQENRHIEFTSPESNHRRHINQIIIDENLNYEELKIAVIHRFCGPIDRLEKNGEFGTKNFTTIEAAKRN